MMDSSNAVVLILIALFVWDKYNKGSEKASLVNQDLMELVKDIDQWRVWQTKGDDVLSSLWEGDLCTKEPEPSTDSRLKCWWHTGTSFYLIIGPIKKEVVSLSPRIVIFHDFVSKQEVETIKTLAIPKLHRAGVGVGEDARVDKGVRDAKHAWLGAEQHPALRRLEQRTGEATDLNMVASEQLQVGRYGMGGHYKPHFDHDTSVQKDLDSNGNRLATVLIYMEAVESGGGATVFPELGLAIKPRAGSAVFWYNLHRNRSLRRSHGKHTGDRRTLHAACPIPWGEKWVINYWVGERGQDGDRNITALNFSPW